MMEICYTILLEKKRCNHHGIRHLLVFQNYNIIIYNNIDASKSQVRTYYCTITVPLRLKFHARSKLPEYDTSKYESTY
jgi:hypothetical protein